MFDKSIKSLIFLFLLSVLGVDGVEAKVCEEGICVGDQVIFGGDDRASQFQELRYAKVVGVYPEDYLAVSYKGRIQQVPRKFVAIAKGKECVEEICVGDSVIVGGDEPASAYQKLRFGIVRGVYPEKWYAVETRHYLQQWHIDQIARTTIGFCKEKFCIGATVYAGGDEVASLYQQPRRGEVVGIYANGDLVVKDERRHFIKQFPAKFVSLYAEPMKKVPPKGKPLEPVAPNVMGSRAANAGGVRSPASQPARAERK